MKIVCLSDTHMEHEQIAVPDGDVLIHAGDSTYRGTVPELVRVNAWLGSLPHRYKIIIAGNHDWLFERSPQFAPTLMSNAHYLLDNFIEIEGLKIYGAPWQPRFFDWAFNVDRGAEIARKWQMIPGDIDVLITHGPPHGILDEVPYRHEHVGCEELLPVVNRIKPRAHIFGHIHAGYGMVEQNGIKFVNASICNEAYQPVNAPIVFDL